MAELRNVASKAGFGAAQTYVASGNVVLESDLGVEAVEAAFEKVIALAFGFHVDVIVRSDRQWVAYANHNPFSLRSESHPERVKICLANRPSPTLKWLNWPNVHLRTSTWKKWATPFGCTLAMVLLAQS